MLLEFLYDNRNRSCGQIKIILEIFLHPLLKKIIHRNLSHPLHCLTGMWDVISYSFLSDWIFLLATIFSLAKCPWYPLDMRLGALQSQSGCGGEEKNSQPGEEWEILIVTNN
jgi:hypothetical protein